MNTNIKRTGLAIVLSLGLGACASSPKVDIAAGTNPQAKLGEIKERIALDRTKQIDVLAPTHFSAAEKALNDAESKSKDGKSESDVLQKAGESLAHLDKAEAVGTQYTSQITTVLTARQAALKANAPTAVPNEFAKADEKFQSYGKDMEGGKFNAEGKEIAELEKSYYDLELSSVKGTALGKARSQIDAASDQGAKSKAPQTFKAAQVSYESAMRNIEANRHNPENYAPSSKKAEVDANKLAVVMATIQTADVSEPVAVKMYDQDMQLKANADSLALAHAAVETERKTSEGLESQMISYERQRELDQKIADIRQKFSPSEAEVFRDGDKIILRLKGMKFTSSKAQIKDSSRPTLVKVKEMIAATPVKKITVEGHTDAVGSKQANMKLSKQRAQSVKKFLVDDGTLASSQVEAKGRGYFRPIASNKTDTGRAANRRVDVIIETNSLQQATQPSSPAQKQVGDGTTPSTSTQQAGEASPQSGQPSPK